MANRKMPQRDERPWYQRGYRRMLVDMHIADWDPKLLAKYDPAAMIKLYRKAGLSSVMFYTQAQPGLCYWPTRTGEMHAGLKGRDVVGEMLMGLRKARMDACAYYTVVYNNWAYLKHPEWRMVSATGQPGVADGNQFIGARYGVCCPNQAGYRVFALSQIEELLTDYTFDGVFIDMTFWPVICVCDACRARFQMEAGQGIPETIDWLSPGWCWFQEARENWMMEFATELTAQAQRVRPGISVYHNFATATANWTLGLSYRATSANDFLGADFYGDPLRQVFISKLMAGLSANQPVEFMTSRCTDLRDHEETKSAAEMRMTALASVLFGAAMLFIDAINPDGTANPGPYGLIGQINRELAAYEPYLGGVPVEDVGIYCSSESKMDFGENGLPLREAPLWGASYPHKKAILGVCRVLQQAHVPFGLITRKQLAELGRYQVVVLPNVLRMDVQEVVAFREYVRAGGRLYASRYTSLTETCGVRHADFMLADVLGCHFAGDDLGCVSYVKPRPGALLKCIAPQTCLSLVSIRDKPGQGAGTLRLSDRAEGKVLATLTRPYAKEWGTVFEQNWISIHSSPPWQDTKTPTLVHHRFGRGQCIYSAADLEALDGVASRRLFLHLIRQLLGERQSLAADTHPAVWMSLHDQPERGRMIAGFLNYPRELPAVPIAEVPFVLRPPAGKRLTRLSLVPGGKRMGFTTGPGGMVRATVRNLEALQLVAAEYSRGRGA